MTDIRNEVVGIIKKVCATLLIGPEDFPRPLQEVGIDSLDASTILLELEERFRITIPDEDIEQLQSIDKMVAYMAARTEGR